jgi:hypothetical protein
MTTASDFPDTAEPVSGEGVAAPAPKSPVPATAAAEPRVIWTMPDLLLVGLVIVLALTAAISTFQRYRHRAIIDRLAEDLKISATGFRTHILETGTAPADTVAGLAPNGMGDHLKGVNWKLPTPVGGYYRWTNVPTTETGQVLPPGGTISITSFSRDAELNLSRADLLELDRRLDDGNLETGQFRTGFNGWPVITVRPQP